MNIAPKYWLGNAESGDSLSLAIVQAAQVQASGGMSASVPSREQMGLPSLYNLQNGVGVVTIAGPLIAGEAGILAFYGGVTGYDDVRQAVLDALLDPEAKSVMLHVSSGGGMVDGCEDLGNFLAAAGQYKPMVTLADGPMCSAAYWLGSYGSQIFTSQTSTLGSLGVILVHMDKTKMMEEVGVKPTVIRAGQYKALSNPYEPLSAEARVILQAQADTIYSVFITAVAANRGVDYATADQTMGQGREFMGKAAVKAGLADRLGTYEQALAYAKSLDTTPSSGNNSRKSTGATAMKVTLNTTQLAAFAAGATLEALGFKAGDTVDTPAPVAPVPVAPVPVAPLPVAPVPAPVVPVVEIHVALAEAKATMATLTGERDVFKASLDAATHTSILAQASVLNLTAECATLKASQDSLVAIARGATGKMLIALGGSDATVATMDSAAIVLEHARASAVFATKFVAGGVASNLKEVAPQIEPLTGTLEAQMIASGPDALRNAQKRK